MCAAVFIPASCLMSQQCSPVLVVVTLSFSKQINLTGTHTFLQIFCSIVSLFVPSVRYSVNRCLVTLGVFTVFFLSIGSDFGGNTHLS